VFIVKFPAIVVVTNAESLMNKDMIRDDTRYYFDVRSRADLSQLNIFIFIHR